MDVKSAIGWVIEKIGFRPFGDEQASYDFVMFVLIVVSAHRINPGHNRDLKSQVRLFEPDQTLFSQMKKKKRSGHARLVPTYSIIRTTKKTSV